MKRMLTVSLLLLAFVLASSLVMAETEVNVSGQVRAREILTDKSLDSTKLVQHFIELRTRLAVEAKVDGNATAYVQLQDSRVLGDTTAAGKDVSGGLENTSNVDLHQAYIQLDRIWLDGLGAKLGRFEVNFGNQRVFGGVGWSNVARSWEGGQFWYGTEKMKATAFVLKKRELNFATGNADFDIMGLYYNNKKLNVDLFTVYEYNALKVDSTLNTLDRISFGMYYHRVHKQMDYTLNAVLQTGSMAVDTTGGFEDHDISAYMLAFEAGYSFDSETKPRLAIGIDITSGDDDSEDTKVKNYSNLYPTAHKFQGYMDYFVNTKGKDYAKAGLTDLMLKGSCQPWAGWYIGLDLHLFSTTVDYNSAPPGLVPTMTSDVGTEIDLTVKTKSVAGVGLVWGASYFKAKDLFAQSLAGSSYEVDDVWGEETTGFWSYMMATVNF